ncbi:MAG: class I SAM-dependent methyltransferase [Planctomycetota bacterium]
MWEATEYELLDFGAGRKLERFGPLWLDRPCPAADGHSKDDPALWSQVDAVIDAKAKTPKLNTPQAWQIRFDSIHFALKVTPYGHVGVFPEQATNWRWLQTWLHSRMQANPGKSLQALNLFAYTGGTTLAMAHCGAHCIHVDASEPAVRWARENAAISDMHELPIRWITEDVPKFVSREKRRKNSYDLIALDPPAFGHGPKGQQWNLAEDLPTLLQQCTELLREDGRILLSAHCTQPTQQEICDWFFSATGKRPESDRLSLQTISGRKLDAGFFCR